MEYVDIKLPSGTYRVDIVRKKIKNVHLKVYRDMTAQLSVPQATSYEWARNFILSKCSWLDKQFAKYKLSAGYNNLTSLKSGSSTQMFGKDLRIFFVDENKEYIEYDEKSVTIHSAEIMNEQRTTSIFEKWWRETAYSTYDSLVNQFMPIFERHGIKKPEITIKKMKTLWGSCNKQRNKVTFNEYLLKANIRSIEYVVLHELTHLIFNNHDKDFYDFLTIYMPDWKERKKQLDTEVVQGL